MATYFHGNSEVQGGDGLQTLVLMNPGYVQYPDASSPHPGNFVFLHHAPPPQTQELVGIPLTSHQDHNPHSMQPQQEISALHGLAPRMRYNLWNSVYPNATARDNPRAQRGLSLGLSSQQVGFGLPLHPQPPAVFGGGSPSAASGVTNGVSGMQSVLTTSKYMKAAQELLDEVVNVGNNGIKADSAIGESSAAASGDGSVTGEASGKSSAELSTVERQEIQMKKAKLISMLGEVEQRYRQYHQQMQMVTWSIEQVGGAGSAKSYVAVALQTISKQFRCLRDAIRGQILGASKRLGEEDCVEGSRLSQIRQQRALEQLGMNAWRPQRGLQERSVSVLRAWLFQHFLHPYPKDSDKHMLAKQTGLTRSQVSNWFINARVRLWKPMVEEMYMEELKEQEEKGSEDKGENEDDSGSMSHDKSPSANNRIQDTPSTSPIEGNVLNQYVLSELEGIAQGSSPKKLRILHSPTSASSMGNDANSGDPNHNSNKNNLNLISIKFGDERRSRDDYSSMAGEGLPANFIPIGRFDAEQYTPTFSGNGVSLTLGLPHCENLFLSGAHQTFLPSQNMIQLGRRVDQLREPSGFGHVISTSAPHSSSAYEIQNRKRFAAQLLPDFVA